MQKESKKNKMMMQGNKVLCILLLAIPAVLGASEEANHGNLRQLGPADRIKSEWPECIGKSGDECLDIIGKDLGVHPLRFLKPEIYVPRQGEDYNSTYYKVGISVNIMDEVTGDKNKGTVCYPLPWVTSFMEPRSLGCWDCAGLDGNECCDKIKESVQDHDVNGNLLDCFIYQDPPTPDLDSVAPKYKEYNDGYIAANAPYFIMKYNKEYEVYVKLDVTSAFIKGMRQEVRQRLVINSETMQQIMSDKRVSYDDLMTLARELRLNTAPIMAAQNVVSEIIAYLKENEGSQSLHIASHSYMYSVFEYLVHLIDVYAANRSDFYTPINVLVTGQNMVNIAPKLGGKFLPVQQFQPKDPEA